MTADGLTAQEYEVLREHLTKVAYERGYEDGFTRAANSAQGLSSAWLVAEKALPDNWRICTLMLNEGAEDWLAEAESIAPGPASVVGEGETPDLALRALADRLERRYLGPVSDEASR